jgi:hypothetical protein
MSTPATTIARASVEQRFVQSRAFEALSRAGFVARGAVYGIIGLLALQLALGLGGKAADQQGAMRALAAQPLGTALLALLTVGLAGYAVWRLTRAALGRGPEGADRGLDRLGALGSGTVYGILCFAAVEILSGARDAGGNTKKTTADAFSLPLGRWVVLAVGLGLVAVAAYQVVRGLTQRFLQDSKTEEMAPAVRTWIARVGTVGHVARAIVFAIVGIFLAKAAVEHHAGTAVGLDGALAKLLHRGYGPVLLGVVAAGLVAFAVYSLSDARYRRI